MVTGISRFPNTVNVSIGSPVLANGDQFGSAVALAGRWLAVGAPGRDNGTGEVFMIQFADDALGAGREVRRFGRSTRPGGGRNINLGRIESGDRFGAALALDGWRLAVGAPGDDGRANGVADSGAVYLLSFNANFQAGSLTGVIGQGYNNADGLGSLDIGLQNGDSFGAALALDGQRLAVGVPGDDANGLSRNSGRVDLFTFEPCSSCAPDSLTGARLLINIGVGFPGYESLPVATGDRFGAALALDGRRLVVGAPDNDGRGGQISDAGAVHLFTLNPDFDIASLVGSIGHGYTNISAFALPEPDTGEAFGSTIDVLGSHMVVGAPERTAGGVVYLFGFDDDQRTRARLEGIIGKGYTGGKNIDIPSLVAKNTGDTTTGSDGSRLGTGVALSYSDHYQAWVLAVGAANLDGRGGVLLFSFLENDFGAGALDHTLSFNNVDDVLPGDRLGQSVALQFLGDHLYLAAGAPGDDGPPAVLSTDSGSVRLWKVPAKQPAAPDVQPAPTRFSYDGLSFEGLWTGRTSFSHYPDTSDPDRVETGRVGVRGGDEFGSSVALGAPENVGGSLLMVAGAPGDDGQDIVCDQCIGRRSGDDDQDTRQPDSGAIYLWLFDGSKSFILGVLSAQTANLAPQSAAAGERRPLWQRPGPGRAAAGGGRAGR